MHEKPKVITRARRETLWQRTLPGEDCAIYTTVKRTRNVSAQHARQWTDIFTNLYRAICQTSCHTLAIQAPCAGCHWHTPWPGQLWFYNLQASPNNQHISPCFRPPASPCASSIFSQTPNNHSMHQTLKSPKPKHQFLNTRTRDANKQCSSDKFHLQNWKSPLKVASMRRWKKSYI
jgi:hypothetical protein